MIKTVYSKKELEEVLLLEGVVIVQVEGLNYLHIQYNIINGDFMKQILEENEIEKIIFHQ